MRNGLDHAPGVAGRTVASPLACEGHKDILTARPATCTGESTGQHAHRFHLRGGAGSRSEARDVRYGCGGCFIAVRSMSLRRGVLRNDGGLNGFGCVRRAQHQWVMGETI